MKFSPARAFNAFLTALLAGVVFWTPNVLVHWLRGYRFSELDSVWLTFLLPLLTLLFLRFVRLPLLKQPNRLAHAVFAVLGIWLTAPSMLTFSATFTGGGLSQEGAWHFFVVGTALFPVFTLTMSTYDGTLFAVLLATVALPVLANFRVAEVQRA